MSGASERCPVCDKPLLVRRDNGDWRCGNCGSYFTINGPGMARATRDKAVKEAVEPWRELAGQLYNALGWATRPDDHGFSVCCECGELFDHAKNCSVGNAKRHYNKAGA